MNVKKRMEWLTNFSIIHHRYIHDILMMMEKRADTRIPTMGVIVNGTAFTLLYNPEFVESLSDAEAMFVFSHESFHLMLHHCTRRRFDDRSLGNISTDLAVNELIERSKDCKRPMQPNLRGMYVDDFKKKKMFAAIESKQSSEWYYERSIYRR